MNLDELHPILAAYRAKVQPAWSPATAHEGYDGKAGDPAGQCGVTSAWLQRRLREDHGIETGFCIGTLSTLHGEDLPNHCWLEFATTDVDVIVDLTADQHPHLRHLPVVCVTYAEMYLQGIHYEIEWVLTTDGLLTDPVHGRLAMLTEALS